MDSQQEAMIERILNEENGWKITQDFIGRTSGGRIVKADRIQDGECRAFATLTEKTRSGPRGERIRTGEWKPPYVVPCFAAGAIV